MCSYTNIIKCCTTKELKTGVDLFYASFKTSTNAHRMETDVMITPIVPTTMDRLLVLAKMASREMELFVLVIKILSYSYFLLQLLSLLPFLFLPVDWKQPLFMLRNRVLEAYGSINGMSVTALDNQISGE